MNNLDDWLNLPDSNKLYAFQKSGIQIGLPPIAIEKDWWTVQTLAIIFSMDCAPSMIFKGGTSLSKAWNLLERLSYPK